MNAFRLAMTAAPAALVLGSPAVAQITPEEVLDAYSDYLTAFGLEVSDTRQRNGGRLAVSDYTFGVTLPEGAGEIRLSFGPLDMVERPDGSVLIVYPDRMPIRLSATLGPFDPVDFVAEIEARLSGSDIVATGTPEDFTVTTSVGESTYSLLSTTINGQTEFEGFDTDQIDFALEIAETSATSRFRREAGLLYLDVSTETGPTSYRMMIEEPSIGLVSRNTGETEASRAEVGLAVPAAGIDYLRLDQALRAGLSLSVRSESSGSRTESLTEIPGEAATRQESTTGSGTGGFVLDASGVSLNGTVRDASFLFDTGGQIPFPISADIGEAVFEFALPLLAGGTVQPAIYRIAVDGLTTDDFVWRIIDPVGLLPRDPVSVDIDVSAGLRVLADLADFQTMSQLVATEQMPFELDTIVVDALDFSAAGVSVEADGKFTLDLTDLETFDGMPRPTGAASARLTGGNALLDTLVTMGLVSEQDASAARLSLGLFARVVGDDQLETSVEVTEDAQVIVNGQRIR